MKAYKYNFLAILLLFGFVIQAQTFDKKIEDRFKVNSDVEIVINASNMDVDIETWNKNEVSIVAVMEVEGLEKKEAEKILKKWNFEALGNKSKVKITSMSENVRIEIMHDFDFDFDFPEIDISHIEIPEFEIPEMPEMPEMPEFEEFEFDYEIYKNDSTYLKKYKKRISKSVEKFKNSDWKKKLDSFRNSKEFKLQIEEMKRSAEEMKIRIREHHNSDEFKHSMEAAKKAAKEATKHVLENRDIILEQAEIAREATREVLEEVRRLKEEGRFEDKENMRENVHFNFSTDEDSKIKIRKHLKIKVPKKATFDLDIRHGKVTIPESNKKMSANMSYSNFVGGAISGTKNELVFSHSPVVIRTLNSSNITLKNVPNAEFGTFNNVNLFSNSSDVIIEEVGSDVALSQKFGNLNVIQVHPDFKNLNLIIDSAKANVDISNAKFVYQINGKKSAINLNDKFKELSSKNVDDVMIIEGYNKDKTSQNKLFLTGVFSTINLN